MEIGPRIANLVRDIARAQRRSEEEVLEEALVFYLRFYKSGPDLDIGAGGAVYVDPSGKVHIPEGQPRSFAELFERVARWQRERGVEPPSDEEAMRLAVEEQHAWRSGREARR